VLQPWFNKLAETCQCCAQGKDARRPAKKRRCCAIGKCCEDYLQVSSLDTLRNALRSMLSYARDVDELVDRNAADAVKLPTIRSKRNTAWTTDEARRFLESALRDNDPFYAAYVMVLVLAMRKGEVLGQGWDDIDFDENSLMVAWQLQRVGKRLLRREVKTEASEAPMPLPDIALMALKRRKVEQEADRRHAESIGKRVWQNDYNLVFTTRYGTPVEPRNFLRSWDRRCELAGVRYITVHDARRTCATLLVDLGVHPRVIMAILRHAQFSITMNIYAQAPSKETREALKRLGESFGDGFGTAEVDGRRDEVRAEGHAEGRSEGGDGGVASSDHRDDVVETGEE
jgi:integrase